ncbi:DUF1120 domain-containing protein [Yersinia ruckeri]|uniref:DUF1120 domain-containing protein n=1 Tax=Yersinia ruckeri TaxID=29486 RepID=UPI002238BA90|nr:DUF1120 domain-containing protein [Yersinia ruckeri]MCW6601435.1 DUF1120 domain-containing protein [Yersinia ruckeri]
MMSRFLRILIGISMAMFASATVASTSASINFSADIEPVACQLSIAGVVDYGEILQSQLSSHQFTSLPPRPLPLISVQCDAKTSLGFKIKDSRSGIAAGATLIGSNGEVIPSEHHFSLGKTRDGEPIGAWGGIFTSSSVDGRPTMIARKHGTGLSINPVTFLQPDGEISLWAERGEAAIGEVFTLQGEVIAGIIRQTDLPGGDMTSLDGVALLEIIYL